MKREEMDAIVAGATEAPWQRCVDELEDGRWYARGRALTIGAPIVWTSDGGANGIPVEHRRLRPAHQRPYEHQCRPARA